MSTAGPARAVIWDMDGTLVDSSEAVPDAFIETVKRLGGPGMTREEVVSYYDAGAPHVMLGLMLGREGTPEDGELYHQVLGELGHEVRVHDGVEDALGRLRDDGVPMAVFTGNSIEAARILLGATGLAAYFDHVVGGNQVPRPKPAPDGVLLAAQHLDVATAECLYVGDSPLDVGAARDAGARPVAAGWGHLYAEEHAVTIARTPGDVVAMVSAG